MMQQNKFNNKKNMTKNKKKEWMTSKKRIDKRLKDFKKLRLQLKRREKGLKG